jgi:hypothetical protein
MLGSIAAQHIAMPNPGARIINIYPRARRCPSAITCQLRRLLIMQFSKCLLLLFPGISIAEGLDPSAKQEGFLKLEKRKGCSGNRLNTDECQGNRIRAFNSFHNW